MPQTLNKWNFYVSMIYKKYQFCCQQMCFFKLKMHQNRFRPGLRPGPRWGAYDAPPDPLVGWGGGNPLPIPVPLNAFGVSIPAP